MFSRLFSHHYYLPPEHFHQFSKKPTPISSHSLSLLTPALATTYPYSDSEQFLVLSLAYKQNYAICVVFFSSLKLLFFSEILSRLIHVSESGFCFIEGHNNISFYGYYTLIDPLFSWINVGLFLSVMDNDAMLFLSMLPFKAASITKLYLTPIFQPHTKGYFIDFMSPSHSLNYALFFWVMLLCSCKNLC